MFHYVFRTHTKYSAMSELKLFHARDNESMMEAMEKIRDEIGDSIEHIEYIGKLENSDIY